MQMSEIHRTAIEAAESVLVTHVGRVEAARYCEAAERLGAGLPPRCYTQEISDAEGPYLMRYYVCPKGSVPQVWIHEILRSDPDPYLHDHPWDYTSVILTGAYQEETLHGLVTFDPGATLRRPAEALHRLHLNARTVTLIVAGRQRRRWGFATPAGWIDAARLRMH